MAKARWSIPPQQLSTAMIADLDMKVKRITARMLQGVVFRSPVDTGAYRGNHRVGVGKVDYTTSLNDTANVSTSRGLPIIMQNGGLGKVVYISNNLPYAIALENGHSKQAPMGIYKLTFKSVVDSLK